MARTEPTWSFTGTQVVNAIRVKVTGLDEAMRISRENYEQRRRAHDAEVAEWEKLPERKRGRRPMFGDESMAHMSHTQWLHEQRAARLAEVGAYALEPDRVFDLTIDDIDHFGLGDRDAIRSTAQGAA